MTERAHDAFAVWTRPEETVAFLKGRVALHALLRAAGVGPGDEVLVPGFTCVVVPAAILYTGATPVFFDVDLGTMNGDLASARTRVTERTKVVVTQHTFGAISDPDGWQRFAREHGLHLLEDAAHAMGATHGTHVAGRIGDGAFTSLQWSKTVTTGLGGLARLNTAELRSGFDAIADDYRDPSFGRQVMLGILEAAHGILYRPRTAWMVQGAYRGLGRLGLVPGSSDTSELELVQEPAGYRARFGSLRRRRLRSALASLESTVTHRRRIAARVRDALGEHGFPIQTLHHDADSAHLRVACTVENRDEVLESAARQRIELGDWFDAPLHPSSAPQEVFGYVEGSCPRADYLTRRLVNVPTHRRIDEAEADRIVRFLVDHAEPSNAAPAFDAATSRH